MTAGVVILAAGAGRRLGGVAKALLPAPGGGSFLARIWETARSAGVAEGVVVVGPPHDAVTAAEAGRLGLPVAVNPEPDRGMASSVAIGFEHASRRFRSRRALLWPVDHPRVDRGTVAALLAANLPICVPVHGGRGGHPTLFDRAVWPELCACADLADGARQVVRADQNRVARLDVDDVGVTRDVDLRDDLPAG